MEARNQWDNIFKEIEKKNLSTKNSMYSKNLSFRNKKLRYSQFNKNKNIFHSRLHLYKKYQKEYFKLKQKGDGNLNPYEEIKNTK